MAWVRLDDTMWTNRKARKAGESLAAYVLLLSWSGWALSDGVIPWDDVEFICGCVGDVDRHVAKLVEVGLVDFDGGRPMVHGERQLKAGGLRAEA